MEKKIQKNTQLSFWWKGKSMYHQGFLDWTLSTLEFMQPENGKREKGESGVAITNKSCFSNN